MLVLPFTSRSRMDADQASTMARQVGPVAFVSRRQPDQTVVSRPRDGLWVQSITTEADLDALVPEWEQLAAGLLPWTPFATPLWNLTHWKHFRRHRLAVRDDLQAYAIRTADGRLVGVAPMHRTVRPGVGPGLLRALVYFGADPNVTEIRGVICRREDEAAVVAVLFEAIGAEQHRWDWLHWGALRHDGAARAEQMAHTLPVAERIIPSFHIELPESFEALRARLSRNTKEALRKCTNSLKRAGHEFVFTAVTAPAEVDAAIDIFFRLHQARAESDAGVKHANAFEWPESRAFLRDYARQSAERGELRIFQLWIAGEVVATRIGFCTGTDLYFYYSGHLPAFGRYSVMTTTVAEALKWAIASGVRRAHLSIGRDRSKLRWVPREIKLSEAYQAAPTLRGRVMQALFLRRQQASVHWGAPGGPDDEQIEETAD